MKMPTATRRFWLGLAHGKYFIPIEVKSVKQGCLRSLHEFMDRADHPFAIRLLANRFSVEETKTPSGTPCCWMNLPYYLAAKSQEYAERMVEQHGWGIKPRS